MAVLRRPGPRPALTVRTPSATSPASPPAAGGPSWSCVHNPLKLKRTMIFRFARLEWCKVLQVSRSTWTWRRANCGPDAELSMADAIPSARLRVAGERTQERTPTLETNSNRERNLNSCLSGFRYRIRRAISERLGARKAYAGTRPNENNFMVLVSAAPRKGDGCLDFAQEDRTCGFRGSGFGFELGGGRSSPSERSGLARIPFLKPRLTRPAPAVPL